LVHRHKLWPGATKKAGVLPADEAGVIGPNYQVMIDAKMWDERTKEK
jgi:hypothetical protein